MTPVVALLAEPTADVRQTILDGLRAFNGTVLLPGLQIEDLAVAIRDPETGATLGGLWGRTGWDWLFIELVFVPEDLRGQGLAGELIALAEDEARRRGCHSAWIDTLNPTALALYKRLGYATFGELTDYPVGYTRTFLQKKLNSTGP